MKYYPTSPTSFFEILLQESAAAANALLQAPIIHRALTGEASLDDYAAFLCQAFHHVRHTVPLLMATGARLPQHYEWLRKAVTEYIMEEYGHE